MSKTFAQLTTNLLQALQDTGAATWLAAETAILLEDALREIPDHRSYLMREVFKIESRTGSADEDKANALVDDANLQFLATDVGKVIYNTTDNTWAEVTAFVDTGELTLSKDIFPDGDEAYEMFNENCRSNKDIYIGDVTDYVGGNHGVLEDDTYAPEYPLGTKRNVQVSGDILTVLVDTVPDSATLTNDLEVFVWFRKRHRVSQLTDLLGTVNGTPAAGAETLVVAGFAGSEIIAEDTLFTIAGIRGTYRTTQATTLSSGAGTIYFWPGLDKTLTTGLVITVIGSTLDDKLERLVVALADARATISKGMKSFPLAAADLASGRAIINTISKGGGDTPGKYSNSASGELSIARYYQDSGERKLAIVLNELNKGKPVGIKQTYSRS